MYTHKTMGSDGKKGVEKTELESRKVMEISIRDEGEKNCESREIEKR